MKCRILSQNAYLQILIQLFSFFGVTTHSRNADVVRILYVYINDIQTERIKWIFELLTRVWLTCKVGRVASKKEQTAFFITATNTSSLYRIEYRWLCNVYREEFYYRGYLREPIKRCLALYAPKADICRGVRVHRVVKGVIAYSLVLPKIEKTKFSVNWNDRARHNMLPTIVCQVFLFAKQSSYGIISIVESAVYWVVTNSVLQVFE